MKKAEQFLKALYNSIETRADSYLELAMALASREYFESVVALSESPIYRRKFSAVYDSLKEVQIDREKLLKANLAIFKEECNLLEGHEIYSGDGTFIKRQEARTMPERVMKRLPAGELVYGHETQLVNQSNSWVAVVLVTNGASS